MPNVLVTARARPMYLSSIMMVLVARSARRVVGVKYALTGNDGGSGDGG